MKLGLVGLGKMGGNMARRLRRGGIEVAGLNREPAVTDRLATEEGLIATYSLEQLVATLPVPRVVWLMLPAGDVTQQVIDQSTPLLSPGDVLIDGGNSFYKDSMRRAGTLEFMLKGQPLKLTAFVEPGATTLFVPFSDLTSGTETYAAGRYLDLTPRSNNVYIVDFNLAFIPYCYYNYTYECPYPPAENRLKVPIRAGERMKP